MRPTPECGVPLRRAAKGMIKGEAGIATPCIIRALSLVIPCLVEKIPCRSWRGRRVCPPECRPENVAPSCTSWGRLQSEVEEINFHDCAEHFALKQSSVW